MTAKRVEMKPVVSHQLALTMVGPYRVSTIDRGAIANLPPRFVETMERMGSRFETMVFHGDGSSDLDSARYGSREEALSGHKEMVRRWEEKIASGAAQTRGVE